MKRFAPTLKERIRDEIRRCCNFKVICATPFVMKEARDIFKRFMIKGCGIMGLRIAFDFFTSRVSTIKKIRKNMIEKREFRAEWIKRRLEREKTFLIDFLSSRKSKKA